MLLSSSSSLFNRIVEHRYYNSVWWSLTRSCQFVSDVGLMTQISLPPPEHMLSDVTIRVEIFTNKLVGGMKIVQIFSPQLCINVIILEI